MRASRYVPVIGGVLLLHGVFLWGLYSGLLQRTVEIFVPITALAPTLEPPAPLPKERPVEPPRSKPLEPSKPVAAAPVPQVPAPLPLAVAQATPAPTAVTGAAPAAVAPRAVVAEAGPAVQKAEAKVELPSSDADYLHNPKPAYPPLSKRRNEQGRVVVRVLIGADGAAQKADVKVSSGFERLDKSALETALTWRYVPGKRGGVAETMWVDVPINFVLE